MENNTSESTNASNIEVTYDEVKYSRVRTGSFVESYKMFGVLVDVIITDGPNGFSASRQEWFSKSICKMEIIRIEGKIPEYYLTAPNWLLDNKKVKY